MEHVYPTPAVKHADNTKEMDVYKNIMSSGSGRGKLCIQVRATCTNAQPEPREMEGTRKKLSPQNARRH